MIIADLGRSLKKLLQEEVADITNGTINVYFEQPNQRWSEQHSNQPTVNLFLYDVRENHTLRQHQWQEQVPKQDQHLGRMQKRTPFRVDCTYILTAWATAPEDEHRLLTECMLALFRYPILPDEYLVGTAREQPFDICTQLARHDKLTNPAELWSALDNQIRPSVSYTATIAMDPWQKQEIDTEDLVRMVTTDEAANSIPAPMLHNQETIHRIGGVVIQKGTPRAGVSIRMKEGGRMARTNGDGRFLLGPIATGAYTLQAWQDNQLLAEKSINVPRTQIEDTYDFILE